MAVVTDSTMRCVAGVSPLPPAARAAVPRPGRTTRRAGELRGMAMSGS
jgi:hypothetical protein